MDTPQAGTHTHEPSTCETHTCGWVRWGREIRHSSGWHTHELVHVRNTHTQVGGGGRRGRLDTPQAGMQVKRSQTDAESRRKHLPDQLKVSQVTCCPQEF